MMLLFHWTFMPVSLNRVSYTEPVQTISWEVLVQGIKCCSCDPHKGCCIYIYITVPCLVSQSQLLMSGLK